MTTATKISWSESTWNPLRGCSRISPGCVNCYAEAVARRSCGPGEPYEGAATEKGWTRKLLVLDDKMLEPMAWKRPRMVFVNSMSDAFHESLDVRVIAKVWAVMGLSRQHTFQLLTKRADRMHQLLGSSDFSNLVQEQANALLKNHSPMFPAAPLPWPLPNVWVGVSVENQECADERVPLLLSSPAEIRFVSAEPLLEPVNFDKHLWGIDWMIVGGESGPDARPFDLSWGRSIMRACQRAGVSAFFKQTGANASEDGTPFAVHDKKGADMIEWPEDLRVQELPRGMAKFLAQAKR